MLCDQLETDLKGTRLAKVVAELFEGKQSDYVKCHECGTVTNTAVRCRHRASSAHAAACIPYCAFGAFAAFFA